MKSLAGIINDRYQILNTLSETAKAHTFMAWDRLHGQEVVIKEISSEMTKRPCHELSILNTLYHPNLTQIHDWLNIAGQKYLVESYAPGLDFAAWAAQDRSPARISLGLAALLRALQYLHSRNLLHLAIRPSQIRVTEDDHIGELPALRLINGVLSPRHTAGLKLSNLSYLAPEILAGQSANTAADLYSLGVVFFEALVGHLPPSPLTDVEKSFNFPTQVVNSGLSELLTELLETLPAQRPSLSACVEVLETVTGCRIKLQPQELKTTYLLPPPIVGRDQYLAEIHKLLTVVANGQSIALHFSGYGKRTMANQTCWLAKLTGLKVIATDQPAALVPSANQLPPLGPEQVDRLASLVVDFLLDQAQAGPTVINFDGCTLEDLVTARVFKQLTGLLYHQDNLSCLLLWTNKLPDGVEGVWESITLPSLSSDQVSHLVHLILYAVEPPLWANQLYAITGGDPQQVVELLQLQIDAGLPDILVHPFDQMKRAEQRLAALSPAEKILLATIAHAPRPIPYRILRAVALPELHALPLLIRRQMVVTNDQGIYPANLILKAQAQREIVDEAEKQLHLRFAQAWQAEDHAEPLVLGHHLLRAEKISEGVDVLLQAPAIPQEDLEYIQQLIPLKEERAVKVQCYLAQLALVNGELSRALSLADQLEKHHPESGLLLRAELLLKAGHPSSVLEVIDQIPSISMKRELFATGALFSQGDYIATASRAKAARNAPGFDPSLLLRLDHLAAISLIYTDQIHEGLWILNHVEHTAHELHTPEMLLRVYNSRGIAFHRLGQISQATEAYQSVLYQAQELGDLRTAATAHLNLGTLAHEQLNFDEALAQYRRASLLAHRCQVRTTEATALSNEANLLLHFGVWSEAAQKLQQAEVIATQIGAKAELGYIALYQASLNLAIDQLTAAEKQIESARKNLDPGYAFAIEEVDLLEGELFLKRQSYAAARELANALISRMPWTSPKLWQAHLLAGKTALHQDPPHPEIAVQELELALALARRMKMINWSWEAQGYLAQAYELLGLEDEARAMVNRFYATIDEFRRHIPLSYRHNFDQRHEVQQAMDLAEQIQDPQWRTSPSASELRQLLKINKELNRCLPLDHLLKLILERATELIGAERGFALMREGDVLTNLASYNIDSEGSKQDLTSFSQKVARLVIEQDQPLLATNAIEDGRFKHTVLPQDFLLRAVLCVPLHLQQKATGALYLDSHFKVGAFQKKHLELLEAFADQVDIALENTRMLQDLNADRMALALAKAQLEGVIARQSEELNAISIRLRSQEEDLIQRYQKANIIGQSKLMRELYFKIDRVAESNLPVFIFGESGTGKELIARAIHYSSPRSQQPFIAINCAAIPVHLLESEFFGHKKGAFTDAINDRLGLFELAGSGTLFLDEISDMPLEMQSKLLRVLQEETFRRVGDDQERKSHCRILSASHKRLEDLVALNKFRQDLFYRIKVIQLDIPPLRQRREDIPLLVQHFLASAQRAQTVSPQAMAALIDYNWPGNVRQLENEISRASVLSEKVIDRNALTIPTAKPRQRRMRAISLQEAMQEVEKDFIENALAEADYNVSVAAERLRMHRVALHRKMRQLGISRDKSS